MALHLNIPVHPDDVLFFKELEEVAWKVAKHYDLPLTSIVGFPMPEKEMADCLGDCSTSGQIRLVLRCTVDGQFVDAPRTPESVWKTLAHELSHLRYFRHGLEHQTFQLELEQAVNNFRVDHKQRIIDKLIKMQASRDGEAAIGNTAAAEAFAGAINRMLIEHELNPSDLDYARATDNDPIIEMRVDLTKYRIEKKRSRIAWQESLARIVANAHLCTFLLRSGSNDIWFVGTKSHATVAEYVYGTLVPAAAAMCYKAYHEYGLEGVAEFGKWKAREPGFNEAWTAAFVQRIGERLAEARKAAVTQAAADVPGGESQALMRLGGAMVKVQQYIDNRFKGRRGASPLQRISSRHTEGAKRGRAAADAMPIGRKGVTGGTSSGPRKLLS